MGKNWDLIRSIIKNSGRQLTKTIMALIKKIMSKNTSKIKLNSDDDNKWGHDGNKY